MRQLFVLALITAAPLAANAQAVDINTLMETTHTITGQPIQLPAAPKLVVSHYTIQPGASLPLHKHPAQRYAYILSGEIDVTFPDLGKAFHSKAGDFIAEGRGQWHAGKNNGDAPVELLVIDQMPEGATTNTIMKDASPASH